MSPPLWTNLRLAIPGPHAPALTHAVSPSSPRPQAQASPAQNFWSQLAPVQPHSFAFSRLPQRFLALGIVKPSFLSKLDEATKSVLVIRSFPSTFISTLPGSACPLHPDPLISIAQRRVSQRQRYIPSLTSVIRTLFDRLASHTESPPSSVPLLALQASVFYAPPLFNRLP